MNALKAAVRKYLETSLVARIAIGIVVGAILAVIFTVLRPLVRLILSVINFCTMGILYVVVDAWLVWTAVAYVENSVQLDSFWWAVAAAIALNAARTLVDVFAGDVKR